ncbi:MAG: replicative DNA helicase [Deltaproteobacteria bacterium]|nr:replicative DNA helicase [Deltaproteobacteria bacterium]
MAIEARKKEAPHRVPPHNLEAEQAVIGGILLEKDSLARVLEILAHDGGDFYSDIHGLVFRAMVSLFEKNTPVDIVTLTDALKNTKALDSVGGVSYVAALADSTPTAANILYYARIVREKSLLRGLITAATEIVRRGYDAGEAVDDFVDEAEKIIFQAAQERTKKSYYALRDLIKDAFEAVEKLYEKKTHVTGVASGFKDLDRLLAGLQPSDLIIIAGRPSMGKTAFALNIAEYAAIETEAPVALFSLEMSKEQLTQRMLASRARVDLHRLRHGRLNDEDWGRLTTAVGTLYEAPIYIDDTPAQSVLELRAKARRWVNDLGIKLIIVDYLQLMRGRTRTESREQEISDISRSLKALAKEVNVPVVALSQLSRRAETRENARPQLSDLRESGAIEQDADVVMFVYRECFYKPCDCPKELCTCGKRRGAEIIVAKQRNGPTDTIKLTFMNELARFEDQTQVDYGDIRGEWVES